MSGQAGFWDFEDRLRELSAEGDPLERLSVTVDFEDFRLVLTKALHGLSLQQTSYLVRDRLSWMRFCGRTACRTPTQCGISARR
jgi:transposase, IS5 family